MKRKNNTGVDSTAISFSRLSKLIYYKVHFCRFSSIDDLTTAVSFDKILSICLKHLDIEENVLLSKKGAKYDFHRYVFMGALSLYSNVDERSIGKKIGRYSDTIRSGTKVLTYYLEEDRDYNASGLKQAVEKILIECEQESGGRFYLNVKPELSAYDGWRSKCIRIHEKENSPYSDDELLDIPVRNTEWFDKNLTSFFAINLEGNGQHMITAQFFEHRYYLYLMQFFGYRFVSFIEWSRRMIEEGNKLHKSNIERLRSLSDQWISTSSKCNGCIFKKNGLCKPTIQNSGFCPKTENNTPSLDEDGDPLKFIYSSNINQMHLFNCWKQ